MYEIIPTTHGMQVIIGDARGKGPDEARRVRHVLSVSSEARSRCPRWTT
jgi:hypothetical protein